MAEQTNSQFLNTPSNTLIVANLTVNKKGSNNTIIKTTEPVVLGAVQQFAYQVQRWKAPIYVIGSTNPITIAKGARQVAGTLQGVILGEDFQFSLIKYFWQDIANNGIQRVNGKDDINQEFGDMIAFIDHFVTPLLKVLNVTDTATQDTFAFNTKTLYEKTLGVDQLKIPPLYLDEIPPITLSLITPIDITDAGLKYETVTLYGLEFVSNDLAIQAGREQIFESVNFIQRSVAKSIETTDKKETTDEKNDEPESTTTNTTTNQSQQP